MLYGCNTFASIEYSGVQDFGIIYYKAPVETLVITEQISALDAFNRSIAASFVLAETIKKSAIKKNTSTVELSEIRKAQINILQHTSFSFLEAFVKETRLKKSSALSITESKKVLSSFLLAEALSIVESSSSIAKYYRLFSINLSFIENIFKGTRNTLDDTIVLDDDIVHSASMTKHDMLQLIDAMTKSAEHEKNEELGITEEFFRHSEYHFSISDLASLSEMFNKNFGITEVEVIAIADEMKNNQKRKFGSRTYLFTK